MNDTTNASQSSKKYIPLIIGIIVIAIIFAGVAYKMRRKFGMVSVKNPSGSAATSSPTPSSVRYKDGTYTVEGDYMTHVGQKKIAVKVTLKDNVVTDSTVTDEADDKMSVRYQDDFIANYKPMVIGKNIAEIHLSKVSGSSLTPNGFNDALQKIEAQAKS